MNFPTCRNYAEWHSQLFRMFFFCSVPPFFYFDGPRLCGMGFVHDCWLRYFVYFPTCGNHTVLIGAVSFSVHVIFFRVSASRGFLFLSPRRFPSHRHIHLFNLRPTQRKSSKKAATVYLRYSVFKLPRGTTRACYGQVTTLDSGENISLFPLHHVLPV
ncbi:hypothetical protein CPC08DRAFT_388259 [Agrocybe pediades]|nr:hypothetical protein CPC08DRAFT_388259 [Agrocybe pediades]